MWFSPDALGRNARSLAHFAATIGTYKMPMTNLLETFWALSSASRPGWSCLVTRIVVVQKRENCIRLIAVGIYRNSRCATRRKKGQKKNKKVSFWGRETKLLSRGAAVSSLLYLSLSLRELDSCRLSRRLGFSAPKDERLFLFFLSSFFLCAVVFHYTIF